MRSQKTTNSLILECELSRQLAAFLRQFANLIA
ncbi:hypothetical protein A1Q_3926 [Vibrio campbellii HY01]|nr:hypothetical protein A1Q_3926 [Vibrio campbellii HY01]